MLTSSGSLHAVDAPAAGPSQGDPVEIVEVDPLSDPRWEAAGTVQPGSGLFASRPWLQTLNDVYGFELRGLLALDPAGAVRAALPFCRVDDALGPRLRVLPFSDYCDPAGDESALVPMVADLTARGLPVTVKVLRCAPAMTATAATATAEVSGGPLRRTGEAAWHGVNLRLGTEVLWQRAHPTVRRNVNRARQNGVKVRAGNDADAVGTFYRLHCHTRTRKYRMLPQPLAFFEGLHRRFGDGLEVLLAEVDGEAVAGVLFLRWGDTTYYKFNASVDTSARPNDLLVWEGLRMACDTGSNAFDFGLSGLDQPGLVRFKEKFATDAGLITTYAAGPGPTGAAAQLGATISGVVEILTDPGVPTELAARAGDALYRYFA